MIFKILLLAFTLNMPTDGDGSRLWLQIHGCPCAAGFSDVALLETHWGQYGVGSVNNPFGMMARPGYPQIYGYARYVDDLMAVWDLRSWVAYSPPDEGELFTFYLMRRRWNASAEYFAELGLLTGSNLTCQTL